MSANLKADLLVVEERAASLRDRQARLAQEVAALREQLEEALSEERDTGSICAAIGKLEAERGAIPGALNKLFVRRLELEEQVDQQLTAARVASVQEQAARIEPAAEAACAAIRSLALASAGTDYATFALPGMGSVSWSQLAEVLATFAQANAEYRTTELEAGLMRRGASRRSVLRPPEGVIGVKRYRVISGPGGEELTQDTGE